MESEEQSERGRPGRGCAFVLAVNVVFGLVVLGAFWVIGASLDQTRSGIVVENGRLTVVSAVCPDERLEAVRLFRIGGTEDDPQQEVLWEVEGEGAFPDRFEIGAELPGLRTAVPLFETIGDSDQLIFGLRSSQLRDVDAFGLIPGELTSGQVASVPALTDQTEASFRDRALEATPCD